MAYDKERVMLY